MNFKAWVTSDKDHLSKWNSCGTILDVYDSPINHSERSPNSLLFFLRRSFKQCSVAETISSWHLRCGSKICKTATLIFLKTFPRKRKTSSFTNIYTNLLGLHFCINCPYKPLFFWFSVICQSYKSWEMSSSKPWTHLKDKINKTLMEEVIRKTTAFTVHSVRLSKLPESSIAKIMRG